MKKVLLVLLILIGVLAMVSCTPKHHHKVTGELVVVKEATCSTEGQANIFCTDCGEIVNTVSIPKTNDHTEVILPAVETTCENAGLTEGKQCSTCGKILVAQQETPVLAHIYDDKYDETCNECGHVRDAECPHTETEIIEGKNATCSAIGYSDGEKCTKCGEIIIEQKVIEMLEHPYTAVVTYPTPTEQGYTTYTCECGDSYIGDYTPVLVASEGLDFTLNEDGQSYTVAGIGTCTDTDIVIPSEYEGLPVTTISTMAFCGSSSLTSVVIPDTVTSLQGANFYACSSLTYVHLGRGITEIKSSAVTIFGATVDIGVFTGCISLTTVVMPDSVTSIGINTFWGCSSLTSIVIPDSITSISEGAFDSCKSLASIVIPDSMTSIGKRAFSDCTSLTSITIPYSVTSIGEEAFTGCTSLVSVTIGESVTSIGSSAFNGCYSLVEVCNKSNLNINKPSGNYGYVASYAKQIITNESHSFLKYVGDYIFYDDGMNVYLVKYIGDKTEISLPEYDGGKEYEIYKYAFYENDSITNITILDFVTSIGNYAFQGCTSLKSINIPDSVTSIGSMAFEDCTSLTSITIPDSVTIINGFRGCASLTSIVIPDTVTIIASEAFTSCTSLISINFEGTVEQWNDITKGFSWNTNTGSYTIYCTDGQIAKDGTVTYK